MEESMTLESCVHSLDIGWTLICGFIVFSMQCGFAMLEVGSVRKKHLTSILAKNVLDTIATCLFFRLFVAFFAPSIVMGDNGAIRYDLLFFQSAFCSTAVTICSGSMAERTPLTTYVAYCMLVAGFVYPEVAESAWGGASGGGALKWAFRGAVGGHDYHDFAGGGVVHVIGGVSALAGNLLLGRRIMRPDGPAAAKSPGTPPPGPAAAKSPGHEAGPRGVELTGLEVGPLGVDFGLEVGPPGGEFPDLEAGPSGEEFPVLEVEASFNLEAGPPGEQEPVDRPEHGWPRKLDDRERDKREFKPQSHLQAMGMFFLWVGWYGFNAGSTLGLSGPEADAAGVVAWNTMLAAVAGGLGACVCSCLRYCIWREREIDVGFLCNGVLVGLVSITPGCDVASESNALLAGGLAGFIILPLSKRFLEKKVRLDDPVDAIAVHAFGGAWGVLLLAFYQPSCTAGGGMEEQRRFCSESFSHWEQLGAQLVGVLVIALWTFLLTYLLFWTFSLSERVRAEEVDLLEMAVRFLEQKERQGALADTPTNDQLRLLVGEMWQIVDRSALVRIILQDSCAKENVSLRRIKRELVNVKHVTAETGLEEANCCVKKLAKCLHQWQLRYGAMLRLRIPPNDELNGVLTTDVGLLKLVIRDFAVWNKDDSPLKARWPQLGDYRAAEFPSEGSHTGVLPTTMGAGGDTGSPGEAPREASKDSVGGSTCASAGGVESGSSAPETSPAGHVCGGPPHGGQYTAVAACWPLC